jgi:hypothetical protein
MKLMKHIKFVFQEINPCELTKIINEKHIVSKFSNRGGDRAPYIENTSSKGTLDTLVDVGKGIWWLLAL